MSFRELLEFEIYEYKGNRYKVLEIVKQKNIQGNWQPAVMYKKYEPSGDYTEKPSKVGRQSPLYVREYQNFLERFKGVR